MSNNTAEKRDRVNKMSYFSPKPTKSSTKAEDNRKPSWNPECDEEGENYVPDKSRFYCQGRQEEVRPDSLKFKEVPSLVTPPKPPKSLNFRG